MNIDRNSAAPILAGFSPVRFNSIKQIVMVCCIICLITSNSIAQVITNNGATATMSQGLSVSGTSLINNSGTISNNGTMTLTSGINNAGTISGNGNFNISGNWVNNGTFSAGTSTVNFNGITAQNISGSAITIFNNLGINNSNGITISLNTSLNGILTFTNGKITTGNNTLSLGNSAIVNGASSAKYVFGNLQKGIPATTNITKTFEVGDASVYTPVSVAFNGTPNGTGSLTVSTISGQHPNINTSGLNPSKDVARYWNIINNGVTSFTSYNPTFNFVSGDIIGGANYANFHVSEWNGSSWSLPTDGTRNPTSTQAIGLSSFGNYAVGEHCVNPTVIIINQTGTNVLTCATTSINFIATGGNIYLWDNGSTNPNRTVNVAGTYSVTVTNTSGGCTSVGTINITSNGNQPVVTAAQGNAIPCIGGTTSVTVSATGGASPYTGTGTYSNISAGTYTYTVTGANGCLGSTSITITQPTNITYSTNVSNVSGCSTTLGSITITATGGTGTKVYSDNGGSTYQGASLFSNLTAGTYTVKIKDANGCLSNATAIPITTNSPITFTATVVDATSCGLANGKITVMATGGSGYYNYSKDGGSTYQSSNIFNILAAQAYPLRVKDVAGCTSGITVEHVGPSGCGTRIAEKNISVFADFNVYPNPASDHIMIEYSLNEQGVCNIRLIDVFGRIVINENTSSVTGANQYLMDLSMIAKGVYMLILQDKDAFLQSKIVLQ
jgi:adhesin HecA-like repeat protein